MSSTPPWISLPQSCVLGNMPFAAGAEPSYKIPDSAVPSTARQILVFAWVRLAGVNAALSYWHMMVALPGCAPNWFSLLAPGDPTGASVTGGSQAFWLPMPPDRMLTVMMKTTAPMSPQNRGQVEIHGYSLT